MKTAILLFTLGSPFLLLSHDAFGQTGCSGQPRVTIGGVTGFSDLADPVATQQLRASCNVGLYIHA